MRLSRGVRPWKSSSNGKRLDHPISSHKNWSSKGDHVNAVLLNSSQKLIRHLAFWIDGYYNRERSHSTIGYLSPIGYEQQFVNTRRLKSVRP